MLLALGCACAQLVTAAVVTSGSALAAAPIAPDSLGVNFTGSPSDLATASAAGVGVARDQVIAGSNTDAVVQLTAAAHLRLYPMLGLPRSQGPAADASAMAAFVTTFAQRYGRGGSFWAQHPDLPYLPVESYEIGNEPDITPTAPADSTSLHYPDPAAYAEVYESARAALHQVDPAAQAVVGGMLDSGAIGLDQAEQYLAAIGPMDAVGYHPYLYDVTRMEQDTLALRQWLDAERPCRRPARHQRVRRRRGRDSLGRRRGGRRSRSTRSGRCARRRSTSRTSRRSGGERFRIAANDPWFSMVDSGLSETPLGTAYLGEVQTLTTQGCPAAPPAPAPPATTPSAPAKKRITVHGKRRAPKASKRHKHRRRHSRKPAHRRATTRRAVKHR